jgi:AcrR family transcriptional regulator
MTIKASILREKLKEATAQEILAAAEAELAEHGVTAAGMAAIAKRAGVAVGTLYNYFRDKEVLISTLLEERRERLKEKMEEAWTAHAELPFEGQLEGVINALFDMFELHRNFLRIVLANERPALPREATEAERRGTANPLTDRLRPLTARGVKDGVLDERDADLYASVIASLIKAVMTERLNDTSRAFRTATPFVMRVFLDGARRRP